MTTLAQALARFTSYPAGFIQFMSFVLSHETEFQKGHYGDYDFVRTESDPKDPGGATRYGVDQRAHPHVDVPRLTLADALGIYLGEIWKPLRATELDPDVAMCVCDAAINCGNVRSVKWLQVAAGLRGGAVDGNLGNDTLKAVNAKPDSVICEALVNRRLYYYEQEVSDRLREAYLKGWEARMTDLHNIVVLGYGKP